MKKVIIPILLVTAGVLLSLVATTTLRFVTLKEEENTHYHADFMIHINGEMMMLDDPEYYKEEVPAPCSTGEHTSDPLERAHLHDRVPSVVHVEDEAVTWGHFFQNLGYTVSKDILITPEGDIYKLEGEKRLRFILNGKEESIISGRVIQNKDRLLVSYGEETGQELIDGKYNEVTERAEEYNNTPDPEGCSGSKVESFTDKLKRAFIN
ncbi:MAG: hypothetical protein N3A71_02045 [Candidatus Dojkabacteria bacterium]|nr:hypothetical protein [Candidatus Dojkabacteria bacterium]